MNSPPSAITRQSWQYCAHSPQWRQIIGFLVSSSKLTACTIHALSHFRQPRQTIATKLPDIPPDVRTFIALFINERF
ncbi:MAG: hypothetical protein FWC22_00750 [Treponema sp.]|nr:hypothetical protein [Treponema sp.]